MTSKKSKRARIRDLNGDAIDVMPQSRDWLELEVGVDWEWHEAAECDVCHQIVFGAHGEDRHGDVDDSDCEGYVRSDGPMMNYSYLLPTRGDFDVRAAAVKIAHLPLCLVEVDNERALALTGGGTDLSWEICEAYMRLGYLPPAHFSDLPRMCGRGVSPRDRWIIAGCRASLSAQGSRARRAVARLRENAAWCQSWERERVARAAAAKEA